MSRASKTCFPWNVCTLWTVSTDLHVICSLFWKFAILSLLWLSVFLHKKSTSGVLSIIFQVWQIYRVHEKHIENYLFMEKSCMFNLYELVVYLEKCFVAWVTVPLHSNEYNGCRNTDESLAELSVLQCGNCRSVCLFVQFSFSPVVTRRYLQALSTCKMPPRAVFPSHTLPLCSSVEYFTPASTLVL